MIALTLFVVLMFAPYIGLEPGFIDDEASRIALEPKRFFVLAVVVGLLVDVRFFRSRFRTDRMTRESGWMTSLACYYLATLVSAVLLRGALAAPALHGVTVARAGVLTWEAWLLLVGSYLGVFAGGVGFGAYLYRWAQRDRAPSRGTFAAGSEVRTTMSMYLTTGILSGGVAAMILALAHWSR